MKNFIFALGLICTMATAKGQTIQYTVLEDNPKLVPTTYIDLMAFDYEGGLSNPDEWQERMSGLGIGLNVNYPLSETFKINSRLTLFYAGDRTEVVKLPLHIEGVAAKRIRSKNVEKDVKVNVNYFYSTADVVTSNGRWLGTVDVLNVNQIVVPGTYEKNTYARGGTLFRRSTYAPTLESGREFGSQANLGIFGGLEWESKVHVVTWLSTGKSALSSQYLRYYLDGLFYPLASASTSDVANKTPFGFRFGVTGQLVDMKIGFMSRMVPKIEVGMYPLDGLFWNVGIGCNLVHF